MKLASRSPYHFSLHLKISRSMPMHPARLQPSSSPPSCLHPHVAKKRPRLQFSPKRIRDARRRAADSSGVSASASSTKRIPAGGQTTEGSGQRLLAHSRTARDISWWSSPVTRPGRSCEECGYLLRAGAQLAKRGWCAAKRVCEQTPQPVSEAAAMDSVVVDDASV